MTLGMDVIHASLEPSLSSQHLRCSECNILLPLSATFCSTCGARVTDANNKIVEQNAVSEKCVEKHDAEATVPVRTRQVRRALEQAIEARNAAPQASQEETCKNAEGAAALSSLSAAPQPSVLAGEPAVAVNAAIEPTEVAVDNAAADAGSTVGPAPASSTALTEEASPVVGQSSAVSPAPVANTSEAELAVAVVPSQRPSLTRTLTEKVLPFTKELVEKLPPITRAIAQKVPPQLQTVSLNRFLPVQVIGQRLKSLPIQAVSQKLLALSPQLVAESSTILKRVQRFVLGEQHYSTTAVALIETPLRIRPNQEYAIRLRLMGREMMRQNMGGIGALAQDAIVHIEVRSPLFERYAYVLQQADVRLPGAGYAVDVTMPMPPFLQGQSGRRERLQIFFMDEEHRPLYEKPFVIEVFVSHLVQLGYEGHHALTIPL